MTGLRKDSSLPPFGCRWMTPVLAWVVRVLSERHGLQCQECDCQVQQVNSEHVVASVPTTCALTVPTTPPRLAAMRRDEVLSMFARKRAAIICSKEQFSQPSPPKLGESQQAGQQHHSRLGTVSPFLPPASPRPPPQPPRAPSNVATRVDSGVARGDHPRQDMGLHHHWRPHRSPAYQPVPLHRDPAVPIATHCDTRGAL